MQFFSSGKLPMTTSVLMSQIILRADAQYAGSVRDIPHLLKLLVSPGNQREMESPALIIFFQAISGTIFSVTAPVATFMIMS